MDLVLKNYMIFLMTLLSYDPPFKPKIKELNNMMEINSPYENIVKNDEVQQTVNKKEKKKYIPKDYNKNWADEF